MFEIEFTAEAEADLAWFKKSERNIILDGIEANLRYEPTKERGYETYHYFTTLEVP